MKLTKLQESIIGKMRLTEPMTGSDIMRRVAFTGSNRAFAAALLRMRDRGLLECVSMDPITYAATPAGIGAFLDARADERQSQSSAIGTP